MYSYPLAVMCHIYGLDLPTPLVITGMRGAKVSITPPRRSRPCTIYDLSHADSNIIVHLLSNIAGRKLRPTDRAQ